MSELKVNTLSFLVNGKTVEIKKPSKLNFELNKELQTEQGFQDFINDPQTFAKKFDLNIDKGIADQLRTKFSGTKSIKDLRDMIGRGESSATAWAIAAGAYSISSSKIAVAF